MKKQKRGGKRFVENGDSKEGNFNNLEATPQ